MTKKPTRGAGPHQLRLMNSEELRKYFVEGAVVSARALNVPVEFNEAAQLYQTRRWMYEAGGMEQRRGNRAVFATVGSHKGLEMYPDVAACYEDNRWVVVSYILHNANSFISRLGAGFSGFDKHMIIGTLANRFVYSNGTERPPEEIALEYVKRWYGEKSNRQVVNLETPSTPQRRKGYDQLFGVTGSPFQYGIKTKRASGMFSSYVLVLDSVAGEL